MIKHNFDQTPILLETFDQVIRSSEIRSSDPLSKILVTIINPFMFLNIPKLKLKKEIFSFKLFLILSAFRYCLNLV